VTETARNRNRSTVFTLQLEPFRRYLTGLLVGQPAKPYHLQASPSHPVSLHCDLSRALHLHIHIPDPRAGIKSAELSQPSSLICLPPSLVSILFSTLFLLSQKQIMGAEVEPALQVIVLVRIIYG
jgi:hypothetical protein